MNIYRGNYLFFFYVDDGIFLYPDLKQVDKAIEKLKGTCLELVNRGDIAEYLGINFNYKEDGTIVMSQPQLIDQIIKDIKFKTSKHLPDTPALYTIILQRDEKATPFNGKFHYR